MEYTRGAELASGSFGTVYEGKLGDIDVIVKVEAAKIEHPQLEYEYRVYMELGHVVKPGADRPKHWGIPAIYALKVHRTGERELVMERLGSTLEQLRSKTVYGRFSHKTTYMLAVQLLVHLKFLHQNCFLHRDIKPENMLIGTGSRSHIVHILDMGLSKKYRYESGHHIPWETGRPFVGTPRYAPLSVHKGEVSSRWSDLEALGYVLAYLFLGRLPWQKSGRKSEDVYKLKLSYMKSFLESLPSPIVYLIETSQKMPFDKCPHYTEFIKKFEDDAARREIKLDYRFDWNE